VPEALIQDRLNFQRLRSRKVSLEGHQRHLGGRSALGLVPEADHGPNQIVQEV
jgi:hypothetical protein